MVDEVDQHRVVAAHEPAVEASSSRFGKNGARNSSLKEQAHAGARRLVEHRVRGRGDARRTVAVAEAAGLRRSDDEGARHR